MNFDFDALVERHGTASLKWDKYRGTDIIPMWLADMDFHSPPAVVEALQQRVAHGVFGYATAPEELVEVVCTRLFRQYQWEISPEWLVWLPGLVTGLNLACRSIGHDGDEVLTAVPVYPPFLSAPGYSRRNLVTVPLIQTDGCWKFDFERFKQAITPRTKLFLLCNPHNPVGRLFTVAELETLAEICEKHRLVVCSDEIHCELILDGHRRHVPTAMVGSGPADRTITLMAPSKTFNLPGLGLSFAVIPNKCLRQSFQQSMAGIVPHVNALGYAAGTAAYRDCRDWHTALLDYLRENRDMVEDSVRRMPGLTMTHVEATYLAWLDVRETGLKNPVAFFETAGVGLFDGKPFGSPGFLRLNFACPRSILVEALLKIERAAIAHAGQHR
ncbi:MAG: PatB family C-S lyase [Desulfobacterales bacterium]|nr:PatB family C-S lyase [Desulfobacterales bacterium]